MDDLVDICMRLGIATAIFAASSIYEFYACKKIFKEDPHCSYGEIVKRHHPLTKIMTLIGVVGYEAAHKRFAHYHSKDSRKDQDS